MASILDRYGIKEVADVTFYSIDETGKPDKPVLYLDTLKVSTIEQTASDVSAQGGKGNPKLITWDYGKELTVSITDALYSPKSMNLMFGGATAKITSASTITKSINYQVSETISALPAQGYLKANGVFVVAADGTLGEDARDGAKLVPITWYDAEGEAVTGETVLNKGDRFIGKADFALGDEEGNGKGHVITIDAQTFPGTYYVTGDTFARNDVTGEDQFFQFIIYKAKVSAENSITLEAEGDPSTFNMNLTVLRNQDGKMIDLVQYDI